MAKVKSGKPQSRLDRKNQGMYEVYITAKHKQSGSYSDHHFVVNDASSMRDAQNKAAGGLSPALNIVRIAAIFVGLVILALVISGAIRIG